MKRIFCLMLLVCLLFPALAYAQNGYFGLKLGQFTPTGDLEDYQFEEGTYYGMSLGFQFNDNFALEAGYGQYTTEASEDYYIFVPGVGYIYTEEDDEITVKPLTLTLKAILPVGNGAFYAEYGIGTYNAELDAKISIEGMGSDNVRDQDSVSGTHYGIGARYDSSESMSIGIEYKVIDTEKATFKDDLYGTPVKVETELDGTIVNLLLSFRF